MTKLFALAAAALIGLSGCVVHSGDYHRDVVVVESVPNYAPQVLDAEAAVYWDGYYGDDIWTFDALVDDPDSPWDVVSVWADVYDEYAGGYYVESFELFPTDDPRVWYSDWLGHTTLLDPFYPGYTVDIVAYDAYDAYDYLTVWAYTY